jgi:hypothetical protein
MADKVLIYSSPVFQLFSSFSVLFGSYMIMVILDGDLDIFRLLIQPIVVIVFCAFTLLVLFVTGLPIRLSAALYNWWVSKPFIPIAGILLGLMLIVASVLPGM